MSNLRIPQKFLEKSFDAYTEAANILSSESMDYEIQQLTQISQQLQAANSSTMQTNQSEISNILTNIRDCEEYLSESISQISTIKEDLGKCRTSLQEKKKGIKEIWYKSVYHKTIVKELKDLDLLVGSMDTLANYCKDKMFQQAASLIKETQNTLNSIDAAFLPIYQQLGQDIEQQKQLLTQHVANEISSILFLKPAQIEKELPRYSVVGNININYLLTEDDDDFKQMCEAILNSTAGICDIQHILETIKLQVKGEVKSSIKTTLKLVPPFISEQTFDEPGLKKHIPSDQAIEQIVKMINGITAIFAKLMRQYFVFNQIVSNVYGVDGLPVASLWGNIEKHYSDLMAALFDFKPQNLEFQLLHRQTMKQTELSGIVREIVKPTQYFLPHVFNLLHNYFMTFQVELRRHNDVSSTEKMMEMLYIMAAEFTVVLTKNTEEVMVEAIEGYEAFRYKRTNKAWFASVLQFDKCLYHITAMKNMLPGELHAKLLNTISIPLTLILKELIPKTEQIFLVSGYSAIMLEDEESVASLRGLPLYNEVIKDDAGSSLSHIVERPQVRHRSVQDDRELGFKRMDHTVDRALMLDSGKLSFLAAVIYNCTRILDIVADPISSMADSLPIEDVDIQQQQETTQQGGKFQKFKKNAKNALSKFMQNKKITLDRISDFFAKDQKALQQQDIFSPPPQVAFQIIKQHLKSINTVRDKCLFLIRGELRMRVFHFLHNIKGANYRRDEDLSESEWFITQLTKEIVQIYFNIRNMLSQTQQNFIWAEFFDLISDMLIKGLSLIKNLTISKQGVELYKKNISILRKELTQIHIVTSKQPMVMNKHILSQAQEYISLAAMNEKALGVYIKDNPFKFSAEAYEVQMNLLTTARPRGLDVNFIQGETRQVLRTFFQQIDYEERSQVKQVYC